MMRDTMGNVAYRISGGYPQILVDGVPMEGVSRISLEVNAERTGRVIIELGEIHVELLDGKPDERR